MGPSAPPIIETAAAALSLKPRAIAPKYAAKIPNCAAAPNKKTLRIGNQRTEIRHGADTQKDQRW